MAGKGPGPPGKTRWDPGVTVIITSPLTNEQFTEMTHLKGPRFVVLAGHFGITQSVRKRGHGETQKKKREIERRCLLCLHIRFRLKYGI